MGKLDHNHVVVGIIQISARHAVEQWNRLQSAAGFGSQLAFCEFLLNEEEQRQHSVTPVSRNSEEHLDQLAQAPVRSATASNPICVYKDHCYNKPMKPTVFSDRFCHNIGENIKTVCDSVISYSDFELDNAGRIYSESLGLEGFDFDGDSKPSNIEIDSGVNGDFKVNSTLEHGKIELGNVPIDQEQPPVNIRLVRKAKRSGKRENTGSVKGVMKDSADVTGTKNKKKNRKMAKPKFQHLKKSVRRPRNLQIDRGCKCQVCGVRLASFYWLLKHNTALHNGDSSDAIKAMAVEMGFSCEQNSQLSCSLCNSCYRTESALQRHCLQVHNGLGILQALPAPATEQKVNQLTDLSKGDFKCLKCPKIFKTEDMLSCHCLEVHVSKRISDDKEVVQNEHPKMGHPCSNCDVQLISFYDFIQHDIAQHGGKSVSAIKAMAAKMGLSCEKKPEFVCTQCCTALKSETALARHCQRFHHMSDLEPGPTDIAEEFSNKPTTGMSKPSYRNKKYKCIKCTRSFAAKHLLERHCLLYHKIDDDDYKQQGARKVFLCEICGECFNNCASSNWYLFHRMAHLFPNTERICHVCGKIFKSRRNCTEHIRTRHPEGGGPPIRYKEEKRVCNICGSVLSGMSALKLHLEVHGNVKKYICDVCGAGFAVKKYLSRHVRFNHQGIRTKHACSHCGQQFGRKENRDWHVIKVHGTHQDVREKWHLNLNKHKLAKKRRIPLDD